jgi:hypothetical protein
MVFQPSDFHDQFKERGKKVLFWAKLRSGRGIPRVFQRLKPLVVCTTLHKFARWTAHFGPCAWLGPIRYAVKL